MSDHKRPDHWTRRAKAQGYAARSVFKLDEIHRRMPVLPRGGRVLDLGCSPGSWSAWVHDHGGPGTVLVGVDLLETPGYPGAFLHGSALEIGAEAIRERLGGPADLVLSDMAPRTTGNRFSDHVVQIELATMALSFADALLRPGGAFVCKVFDGEDAPAFMAAVQGRFAELRRFRPEATRSQSREYFVGARGFRGAPPGAD
jgi:23S rRNA (uridine2552-2'-O)-methyltransferase